MLSAHCAILLKGGHHPEKNWYRYFIYKREHPFFTQKIIAHKNMVQVVFYRLLLFLTCFGKRFKNSMLSHGII
jgi:hypothetical protein